MSNKVEATFHNVSKETIEVATGQYVSVGPFSLSPGGLSYKGMENGTIVFEYMDNTGSVGKVYSVPESPKFYYEKEQAEARAWCDSNSMALETQAMVEGM